MSGISYGEVEGGERLFPGVPAWVPAGGSRERAIAAIQSFINEHMTVRDAESRDNPQVPAGYGYLAQFVDHDLTVDLPLTSLRRAHHAIPGMDGPRLRLDSVYGRGPCEQPYLYDTARADRTGFSGYFLIGCGDNRNEPDLPRNRLGRALIGDTRNDCNLVLSQLHLALLQLHNHVLEAVVGSPAPAGEVQFREAQRIVQWFYQYVVWNDFVRRMVREEVFRRVLSRTGGTFDYRPRVQGCVACPVVPLEFRLAASRVWLAMIRLGYRLNSSFDHVGIERPPSAPPGSGRFDLRGFRRLPSNSTVQWDLFLEVPSSAPGLPQSSWRFGLPMPAASYSLAHEGELASSQVLGTLLNAYDFRLPSGSGVARAMGQEPISVDRGSPEDVLWAYLLVEAERDGGCELGAVGSEIVAGVIGGLLFGDPFGYLRCDPGWTPAREPALGCARPLDGSEWGLADLIAAAGAPVSAPDIDHLTIGAPISREGDVARL